MLAITPVKFHSPSFGIFFHDVNNEYGDIKYRGDTVLCRDDLYLPEVVDFLNDKYKKAPKVNVIMHACSDGEEVYSFLGVLISKLGLNAAKFLPVSARDIDPEHLKLAKNGVYNITNSEYIMANDHMNGAFYDYFQALPYQKPKDPRLKYTTKVKVDDSLKSFVNFERSNILEDVKKTDLKNTVLFARNFWPYLDSYEREKLASDLSKKMDSSSTLIIGDYDKMNGHVDLLLSKYGFVEKVENVYEKEHEYHPNKYISSKNARLNIDYYPYYSE